MQEDIEQLVVDKAARGGETVLYTLNIYKHAYNIAILAINRHI